MMLPFERALLHHSPAKYRIPPAQERAALKRARGLRRQRLARWVSRLYLR